MNLTNTAKSSVLWSDSRPKNLQFSEQYEMFIIYDFLCLVLRCCLGGPIDDKTWNLNQCNLYGQRIGYYDKGSGKK